ncbi:hypothetical protein SAMN05444266_110227 [Chitinophaga jiangningensis]|uniref:Uncharacterized protein n=1 Tax=Chitinophaga jiangningensis TaxID=1419482 RepID=A0A1M7LAW3_9BACT|nr:hypothetical protein [Chitinophaga jiangningensis]SHM75114.1 hypothetical protein SAMN05444266_110227 [Chitinophaga jiangningensis]
MCKKNTPLLLVAVLIYTIVSSCTKTDKKLYLRGRLFVSDEILLGKKDLPLAQKRVLLVDNENDSLNFLYSDTTDIEGYFLFNLLNDNKDHYTVRFTDTINGYRYFGSQPVARGEENILLTIRLDNSTLNYIKISSQDTAGGGIPNAKVSFFTSSVLAQLGDTTAATLVGTADGYGDFVTYKLKPGTYYVNSQKSVDTMKFEKLAQEVQIERGKPIISILQLTRIK